MNVYFTVYLICVTIINYFTTNFTTMHCVTIDAKQNGSSMQKFFLWPINHISLSFDVYFKYRYYLFDEYFDILIHSPESLEDPRYENWEDNTIHEILYGLGRIRMVLIINFQEDSP